MAYESGWGWQAGNALMGVVVTGIVGTPTRPWIGLVAGLATAVLYVLFFSKGFTARQRALTGGVVAVGSAAMYGLLRLL